MFDESHSLALECKVGGNFHGKENIKLRLIAHKYHAGNMKRTLKRGLKESAFAERKANGISMAWQDCCMRMLQGSKHAGAMGLSLQCQHSSLRIITLACEWYCACGLWNICVLQ